MREDHAHSIDLEEGGFASPEVICLQVKGCEFSLLGVDCTAKGKHCLAEFLWGLVNQGAEGGALCLDQGSLLPRLTELPVSLGQSRPQVFEPLLESLVRGDPGLDLGLRLRDLPLESLDLRFGLGTPLACQMPRTLVCVVLRLELLHLVRQCALEEKRARV